MAHRFVTACLLAALLALVPGTSATAGEVVTKGTIGEGYFFVATDGGIFNFGDSEFKGSTGDITLNQPIVGAESTPTGEGYWLVASDGGVFTFGDAEFFGSTGAIKLNKPIVAMVATPTGEGYWLFASDGGVFTFGDAEFFGSMGDIVLNKPIVGADATAGGKGYYLVASDGGIFTFGDAAFFGSAGDIVLNKPVVGMAALDGGGGYYLVASDGGIFSFGGAKFFGSTGDIALNQPVVGMDLTVTNQGYYLVAADGGIFSFGDAGFFGSTGSITLNKPIVGMSVTPNSPLQPAARDFLVNLRGSDEVPGPGDGDASGFAALDFTDDELCYSLQVANIDSASAAHVHEAVAGRAGPVVIGLKAPDSSGNVKGCVDVDKALVADILEHPQGYYVNVHNASFPKGAVRGQLAGEDLVAANADDELVTFNSESPGQTTARVVTGLQSAAAETIVGLDYRPATTKLYALTFQATDNTVRLYRFDTDGSPAATFLGIVRNPDDQGALTFAGATAFGFDFNPVVDRIRIVTDTDRNIRIHPDTALLLDGSTATAGTQEDGALSYAGADANSGQDPNVVGSAYLRNFDQLNTLAAGDRTTTLFGIDSLKDVLVSQVPPNSGTLNTLGPLGIDVGNLLGFDIATAPSDESGTGLIVFGGPGAASIYAVNYLGSDATFGNANGRATFIGSITEDSPLTAMAVDF